MDTSSQAAFAAAPTFTADDVGAILRERGWLDAACDAKAVDREPALQAWLARAAELLGPQAEDRQALGELLALVFNYDASAILRDEANRAVFTREGVRDVIRELANRILAGGDVESERFKAIVEGMKAVLPYRSRDLFLPIRVALVGRPGEGALDRVILLLDAAAKLPFVAPVKGTRQRMLEFCAALD